jgi:hypothetical protein
VSMKPKVSNTRGTQWLFAHAKVHDQSASKRKEI